MKGNKTPGTSRHGVQLLRPDACTASLLGTFEALARQGFGGSDETLAERIGSARRLGFLHADEELAAIAGLKAPGSTDRFEVFARARSGRDARRFALELGWVFVVPARRGMGFGERLCRELLRSEPSSRAFATTRPDNEPMIHVLGKLGFERTGRPYPHIRRDEHLVLFVRLPVAEAGLPEAAID